MEKTNNRGPGSPMEKEGVNMKLYRLEFINDRYEVYAAHNVVAESPAHCIPSFSQRETHNLRGIEYICEFKDYEDCMDNLKNELVYLFSQIKELAEVTRLYADAGISGKPDHTGFDADNVLSLSFQVDQVYDLTKKARKYVAIMEDCVEEQKAVKPEPQEQITQ